MKTYYQLHIRVIQERYENGRVSGSDGFVLTCESWDDAVKAAPEQIARLQGIGLTISSVDIRTMDVDTTPIPDPYHVTPPKQEMV